MGWDRIGWDEMGGCRVMGGSFLWGVEMGIIDFEGGRGSEVITLS